MVATKDRKDLIRAKVKTDMDWEEFYDEENG